MSRLKEYVGPILVVIILLVIWEMGARWYNFTFIIPTPSGVLFKIWELKKILFLVHLPATMKVILSGLGISILFGTVLAIWMNMSGLAEKTFFPLVVASQTIPIIALAPIFVVWLGYGIWSKVMVTVLITFFPITVSTFDGLRLANDEYRELLQTMGATRWQIFQKVEVPAALPYFYSGLKVAVTLSVIGAAIGEWLGANAGLGYFSRRMMTQFDGEGVFAPIVILSLLGILLFVLVKLVEKKSMKGRTK